MSRTWKDTRKKDRRPRKRRRFQLDEMERKQRRRKDAELEAICERAGEDRSGDIAYERAGV